MTKNRNNWFLGALIGLVCVLMSIPNIGLAQEKEYHTDSKKAIKIYEEAITFLQSGFDKEAMVKMDEVLKLDSNFLEAQLLYGQVLMSHKEYEKSISFLEKAKELDNEGQYPIILRMLGEAKLETFEMLEAVNYLEDYMAMEEVSQGAKDRAQELIDLAMFRKRLMENPVPYEPINLGEGINTFADEHSPTLTVDEQTLYFTRKEPLYTNGGKTYYQENIYVSYRKENGGWGKAEQLGKEVNTYGKSGASSISPDGKYLIFTSCNTKDSEGGCDLYLSKRQGEGWSQARNLGSVINSRSWESQASFAPDGRTIYFVRRVGPRGATRKDIFMTTVKNGQWIKPVPVSFNTSGNEESPYMHPDGKTFYFTSDGYPGLGGRDLFVVKMDSTGKFGEPVNLGYPINSHKDEVSLIVSANGHFAYFASGMEGGFGKWDIYRFELPHEVQPIPVNYTKGLVYNVETKKPVGAKFEIYDLESGKLVVESFSDRQTGEFLVTIPTGRSYAVNVSAKGYLFYSANYTLEEGDDSSKVSFDIPLSPVKEGVAIVLNNVFYEFNSYEIKDISKLELDKLVDLLKKNPTMHIEIGGHTDNKGSEAYNQKLSENRAKSVYEYLISQGIPAEMLSYKGYNFSVPIASNDTKEGRAQNRRTEFKIIKVD